MYLMIAAMVPSPKGAVGLLAAALLCDPALTRLFTPLHPQVGTYEVCTDTRPLESLTTSAGGSEGPGHVQYSAVEELEPLDAFGRTGTYDRAALVRLFGGRRVRVVRGWKQE